MIHVNEKDMEWIESMSLSDIFISLGYMKTEPSVIVQIDGLLIRKKVWAETSISDNSKIRILKILRGG